MSLHVSKCHIVGNHMSWLNHVVLDIVLSGLSGLTIILLRKRELLS